MRIASRLSVPMVLPPIENFDHDVVAVDRDDRTIPTFTPVIRTLSPLLSPPVSANCA